MKFHIKDGLGVHVNFVACDGKLMQEESAGINYTLLPVAVCGSHSLQ